MEQCIQRLHGLLKCFHLPVAHPESLVSLGTRSTWLQACGGALSISARSKSSDGWQIILWRFSKCSLLLKYLQHFEYLQMFSPFEVSPLYLQMFSSFEVSPLYHQMFSISGVSSKQHHLEILLGRRTSFWRHSERFSPNVRYALGHNAFPCKN